MAIAYEVLKDGAITGPWTKSQIPRGLREGSFRPQDSIRQKGKSQWRSIETYWRLQNRWATGIAIVGGLYFLTVGFYLLQFGFHILDMARESGSWPSVPGKIIASGVESDPRNGGAFNYKPAIFYRYVLDHKTQIGSCVNPGDGIGSSAWAQAIVDRHSPGSPCTVYISPDHPRLPVIEPGIIPHDYQMVTIGWMIIYLGALLGWGAVKNLSRPIPSPNAPRRTFKRFTLEAVLFCTPLLVGLILLRFFL